MPDDRGKTGRPEASVLRISVFPTAGREPTSVDLAGPCVPYQVADGSAPSVHPHPIHPSLVTSVDHFCGDQRLFIRPDGAQQVSGTLTDRHPSERRGQHRPQTGSRTPFPANGVRTRFRDPCFGKGGAQRRVEGGQQIQTVAPRRSPRRPPPAGSRLREPARPAGAAP